MTDEPTTERVLVYCRQSLGRAGETKDDSLALDSQERECRLHAGRNGWTVLEPPIRDHDLKGDDPTRPGIAEVVRRIDAERATVVLVYNLARFSRDAHWQEATYRRLVAAGVRLVSVQERHAEDDLIRGIFGAIAQNEKKRIGAYTSAAFRERVRRGKHHGVAPFGFRKVDGRLVVVPDEADWIRLMITKIEAGWSTRRVTLWLNEMRAGDPPRKWFPITVKDILANPALAGGVRCGDVLTWDAHEPIIDRDTFDRLQRTLASRRVIRTKSAASWLEGVIYCACGSPTHLILQRRPTGPVPTFRCTSAIMRQSVWQLDRPPCTAQRKSVRAAIAEREVIAAVIRDLDGMSEWADVYRAASTAFAAATKGHAADRRRCTRAVQVLEEERERLLVLYRRGSLDVARWEREDTDVALRLTEARAALDALPQPPDPDAYRAAHQDLLTMREAIPELVDDDDPSELRSILAAVDATVRVDAERVTVVWPERFAAFLGQ